MKQLTFSLLLLMTAFVVHANGLSPTPTGYSKSEPPLAAGEMGGEDTIVITPSQVGPSTCGRQVIIRQVNDYIGNIIDIEGEQCLAVLTFDPVIPWVVCWSYDITGIVQEYDDWELDQTVYYLAVTGLIALHYNKTDTANIKRIHSLYNLKNEAFGWGVFDLTGHFITPLTAVYQHGQYLYVRDIFGDYGLVDGYIPCTVTNGDLIHDAKAKPYNDNGINVILPNVPSSFTPDGHEAPVMPNVFTINGLNNEMIHHYVRFNGVEISYDNDGGLQALADDTGSLPIYNKFGITVTEFNNERYDLNGDGEVSISDINALINKIMSSSSTAEATIGGEGYDAIGFLTIKDDNLALIPIKIASHGNSPLVAGDINGDGEVDIADINSIIDYILNQ